VPTQDQPSKRQPIQIPSAHPQLPPLFNPRHNYFVIPTFINHNLNSTSIIFNLSKSSLQAISNGPYQANCP
jgi:hypothetical protein